MHPSNWKFTDKELFAILLDQAKVRVALGIPVCICMLVVTWYMDAPFDELRLQQLIAMTAVYLSYNAGCFIIARKSLFRPVSLVIATAVLDPLMLSAWLFFTNEASPLFIGFYIFTILGFGFRIGTQAMWIGQGAAVTGFVALVGISEFWRAHLMLSGSVLILLIAVPLYATILIKKLLAAREMAELESHAKSRLLAKVSHELRTPLNGIVATAQLLKNGKSDPATVSYSDIILHLSDDLLHEINDLLDSAKYHAGSFDLIQAPFDLKDVAAHLRLALSPSAEAKGICLQLEMDRDITGEIQGDKQNLVRVLMNIAGNALKFTEAGEVRIRFALKERSPHSYKIRFSVEDTGIGIPFSEQARVFEPYYRASDADQRKVPGTGLGMSIAYDIVTALGGNLKLESAPGKGSLFYFDLSFPREFNDVNGQAHADRIPDAASIVRGKKILAVEDHPVNRMLLKKILEIDHHLVTLANTGQEALTLLKSEEFDFVLLDYNLDDIDGLAVMQYYHSLQKKHAPVYFLTADATASTQETLKQKGAVDVLHKPLTLDSLRRAIAYSPHSGDVSLTDRQSA